MGVNSSTLDKPVTEKHNEQGTGNGLRYGIASMQGWSRHKENAHCATIQVNNELKDWSFFAVFDGKHDVQRNEDAGKVSAYCAEHLLESIMSTEESVDFADRIRSGFLNLDQSMRTVPKIGEKLLGSTAICAFVTPERIYLANCGDSRAVLCNSGKPSSTVEYHMPYYEKEEKRIKRAFGDVYNGVINGKLDVSRCLGFYKLKKDEKRDQCQQIISPEPDVTVVVRDEKDEFLVIACGGIWKRFSYGDKKTQICNFIRSRLLVTDDLATIANELIDTCLLMDCKSNMSVILVTFPAAPTPSPEAIEKEKNLERDIENLIIKLISMPPLVRNAHRASEGTNVLNLLYTAKYMRECLPNLPPEGNIGTKRRFVEGIFQQCQDRGNMLKILIDEAVDVLLQTNDNDDRSLIELIMEKQKENNSSGLPSSNNNDTMCGSNLTHVQIQTDETESKFQTRKRKINNTERSLENQINVKICEIESPAKRTVKIE